MKTSDKLYNLNADISLLYIAKQKSMEPYQVMLLNEKLGEIIEEIRQLEDDKKRT